MMRRLLAIALLVATFSLTALGAGNGAGLSPLFSHGAGGRALGMGGANVALANDASSVFWNPATLTALSDRSLSLLYLPLPEGTRYSAAAFGWPTVDYGSFAVAAFLLTTDQIQRRDNLGRLLGDFSANQQMYLIGYGKSISSHLAIGATVKLFGESFDNTSAFGAGGDLGIKFTISEYLSLGFNAQNLLAPKLRLDRDAETLPRTLKGGVGMTIPFAGGRNSFAIEVDVDKTEQVDPQIHVGAEVAFLRSYFLRGGYDVDQINLGAGLHLGFATLGYTYRTQDFFQPQHQVTLDLSLGGSTSSILARREEEKLKSSEKFARQQREQELAATLLSARNFYDSGVLDSAQVYYQIAEALTNGANSEISQRLAEIKHKQSDKLTATVRAGVLAETDSIKAAELFSELNEAINLKDIEAATLLIDRLRPAFGNDKRFRDGEASFGALVIDRCDQLNLEATRMVRENNLADAAVRYAEILKYDPGNATARRNLKAISDQVGTLTLLRSGIEAYQSGDTVSARQSFESLLTLNPNDSAVIGLLQLLKQQTPTSALAELQKNEAIWKVYLEGIAKFREGEYEAAITLWEQVLAAYPRNTETEKNIQQAKLRIKQNDTTN
jgi:tetratricopeptide (TPR) repeat protein